jgi:hypothetical protein
MAVPTPVVVRLALVREKNEGFDIVDETLKMPVKIDELMCPTSLTLAAATATATSGFKRHVRGDHEVEHVVDQGLVHARVRRREPRPRRVRVVGAAVPPRDVLAARELRVRAGPARAVEHPRRGLAVIVLHGLAEQLERLERALGGVPLPAEAGQAEPEVRLRRHVGLVDDAEVVARLRRHRDVAELQADLHRVAGQPLRRA